MLQRKILVALGPSPRALKSVHYAFALAERIQAQLFVLQQANPRHDESRSPSGYVGDALLNVINSAREAGLSVSHYVAASDLKGEIISLSNSENIELVVFGTDDWDCSRMLKEIRPFVSSEIIQVRAKDQVEQF